MERHTDSIKGVRVLSPLPIADMHSADVPVIDIMVALQGRAKHDGSYHATVALRAIDAAQLDEEGGLHSPKTVKKIRYKYGFAPMARIFTSRNSCTFLVASGSRTRMCYKGKITWFKSTQVHGARSTPY